VADLEQVGEPLTDDVLRRRIGHLHIVIAVLLVALLGLSIWFVQYRQDVDERLAERDTCEILRDLDQAVRGYAETEC
jgi:hypothetical protein